MARTLELGASSTRHLAHASVRTLTAMAAFLAPATAGRDVPSAARWLAREPLPPYLPNGRLKPGLSQLGPPWAEWIIDPPTPATLELKRQVLARSTASTVSVSDGCQDTLAAEAEVCAMLAAHLPEAFPEHAHLALPPAMGGRLLDAALAIDEDLVLLRDADAAAEGQMGVAGGDAGRGGLVMAAAVVHFSFGGLEQKVGRSLGAIHAPVPHYATSLQRPVDAVLGPSGKLSASSGFSRANWELRRDGSLLHPSIDKPGLKGGLFAEAGDAEEDRAAREPSSLWLRTEYQTVRRLPQCSRYVLFTIRTLTDPLPALASCPAAAAALEARVRALSKEMAGYKGSGLADPLIRQSIADYLHQLAVGSADHGDVRRRNSPPESVSDSM